MSDTYIASDSIGHAVLGSMMLLIATPFAMMGVVGVQEGFWMSAFFGWLFAFVAGVFGGQLLWKAIELYDVIEPVSQQNSGATRK